MKLTHLCLGVLLAFPPAVGFSQQKTDASSASTQSHASKKSAAPTHTALASTKAQSATTSKAEIAEAARRAEAEVNEVVLDEANLHLASVSAMVLDIQSGETLYSKNTSQQVPIASITKLMTAMVVLDAKLDLDEVIQINKEDRDTLKNTYSRMRFGTEATRHDMLRLALMSSENRAASALGRHYPGGIDSFVKAMNDKAKKLGMTNTHFVDSTGLSSHNQSTASDLAKMVTAASKYPLIHEFTTTAKHDAFFKKPRYTLAFYNTNLLVKRDEWNIQVSKTGYTDEAGRCLVMLAKVADRPVAIVLLDSLGKRSPVGDAGRIRQWMETGKSGSVPMAARNYERAKTARMKEGSVIASNRQG